MKALRYQARLGVWWRRIGDGRKHNGFWVGPFATATGAATLSLDEQFTEQQRQAWRTRP